MSIFMLIMDVKHFKQGHKVCNTLPLGKRNYFPDCEIE